MVDGTPQTAGDIQATTLEGYEASDMLLQIIGSHKMEQNDKHILAAHKILHHIWNSLYFLHFMLFLDTTVFCSTLDSLAQQNLVSC